MKTIATILLTILFLSSCASMQTFQTSDITEDGIKYKYGSKQGIVVGDTISAYKKSLRGRGVGVLQTPVGTLTITKVENDYSFMKKNGEFEINENVVFQK